jgi:hypothetical protein
MLRLGTLTLGIVVTGLFSGGFDNAGPCAGPWGFAFSKGRQLLIRVLRTLVSLHLLGVAL